MSRMMGRMMSRTTTRAVPLERGTSRLRRWWTTLSLVCAAGLLLTIGIAPAAAVDYPTWDEVQSARSTEASKNAEISRIRDLITNLTSQADAAQRVADQRAAEFEAAQIEADKANLAVAGLQNQVTEATTRAAESQRRAGQLAAMLARGGGDTASIQLFLSGDSADDVLSGLGTAAKLTEAANAVYETASFDRNTARSLSEQATVAAAELSRLAGAADAALQSAAESAAAAQAAVVEQQVTQETLQAQLATLVEDRTATEADFAAGERERERIRAEAQAAAAAAASSGSADAGQLSSQGWIKPVSGRITSSFGPRLSKPVAGVNAFHSGTDLGASCDATVRAATGGTVIYSGWLGSYGNWVLIDHGDGVQTGYAHNRAGGLLVSVGQKVAAGDPIALVGSTGASSGCHSHFEVRTNGSRTDAVPFMRNRGATLG
jgi:murein DD-endopeptidase MepM/ murein hydrolase activator NlpD